MDLDPLISSPYYRVSQFLGHFLYRPSYLKPNQPNVYFPRKCLVNKRQRPVIGGGDPPRQRSPSRFGLLQFRSFYVLFFCTYVLLYDIIKRTTIGNIFIVRQVQMYVE